MFGGCNTLDFHQHWPDQATGECASDPVNVDDLGCRRGLFQSVTVELGKALILLVSLILLSHKGERASSAMSSPSFPALLLEFSFPSLSLEWILNWRMENSYSVLTVPSSPAQRQ